MRRGGAEPKVTGRKDAVCIACEQDPLDARSEADAGHLRATERGHEPVVAAASSDSLEDVRAVLEGRTGVVVETPDEVVVLLIGDGEPVEATEDRGEVQPAVLAQRVTQLRRAALSPRHSGRLQSRMRRGFADHL